MRFVTQALQSLSMASLPLLMVLDDDWKVIYGASVFGVTVVTFVALAIHLRLRAFMESAAMLMLLILPFIPSIYMNIDDIEASTVVGLAVVVCYAVLGMVLLSPESEASYRTFAALGAVTLAVTTVLALNIDLQLNLGSGLDHDLSVLDDLLVQRRSGLYFTADGLHPNIYGLFALVVALLAVGLPFRAAQGVLLALALGVTWIASSRAAMLGIVVAVFTYALCSYRAFARRSPEHARTAILLLLFGAVLVALAARSAITDFVLDDVLLADNADRGLDSGFSGRTVIWQAAVELWLTSPVFGVGYGQQVERLGLDLYSHNLVLTLLIEGGVFALAGFTFFSWVCLRNGLRLMAAGYHTAGTMVVTVIVVYWIYGIFEGHGVNVGNPLSVVFFLVCFSSLGYHRLPARVGERG